MATRTHFHRSRFINLLSELLAVDGNGAMDAFAEKLGNWIPIADAIGLRASHTASAKAVVAGCPPSLRVAALQTEFAAVRGALETAIAEGGGLRGRPGNTAMPVPPRGTPLDVAGAYEPFRRYYLMHQREMDLKAKPLRARARDACAHASPALRQLAALDAAMDGILGEREAMLLAKVPQLLEQRFKQLRREHHDALAANPMDDSMERWMQRGGWMARFCQEMQAVLLAEWEMRLQPALGLLEALHNEKTKST